MNKNVVILALSAMVLTAGCNVSSEESHADSHAGPTMNFHRINPELATGGHLTDDRSVETLSSEGVTLVIDLRDKPPEGHKERLEAAGIRYENVPVVWKDPKLADFSAFSAIMDNNPDANILVQCQANYRASAMTYAYRVASGSATEDVARKDLEAIWTPEGTWEVYIDEILTSE